MEKVILFSAPSGSGKSTIINQILKQFDCFEFSISATSRKPRGEEQHGVDYYFLSEEDFKRRAANGEFLEWEEVYQGTCYGTLKSEVSRIWGAGHAIIFDVDVNGGKNIKRYFGDKCLSIFIVPPSLEVLEQRLRGRGTDEEASIQKRLARSEQELKESGFFDRNIVNDDLATAVEETRRAIAEFLAGK